MLILYYKRLACNRKNDLWLNESPALNFLKDFKIMSHEWQGGVGQKKKKMEKEGEMFKAAEVPEVKGYR